MPDLDDYLIQPITTADEPFLREMLYQAIYVPPGAAPPSREIVSTPELSRYVQGWGQADDYGLKAVAPDDMQPVGAAWVRLLAGKDRGYGYVDGLTPELTVAVTAGHRGRGIGTLLLKRLLEGMGGRRGAVSLSVSAENRALRLYKRLGFEVVGQEGSALTMKKGLAATGREEAV